AVLSRNRFALAGESDDGFGEWSAAVGRRRKLIEALCVLVATVTTRAEHVREAHVRSVDVEERRFLGTLVGECVHDTGRRRHERACPSSYDVCLIRPEPERDLSAQHVEGVAVLLVDV